MFHFVGARALARATVRHTNVRHYKRVSKKSLGYLVYCIHTIIINKLIIAGVDTGAVQYKAVHLQSQKHHRLSCTARFSSSF